MQVIPVRNSVICRKVERSGTVDSGGIVVDDDRLDTYEVVSFSQGDGFEFSVGDIVVPARAGDEFEVAPGKSLFRFDPGEIMCRVVDP